MKKIGLIGGTSWVSTIDYYRIINECANQKRGGLHTAEIILYSVNFHEFQSYLRNYDWDHLTIYFSEITEKLINAGAEIILLGANTAHVVYDPLQHQFPQVKIIHIAQATGRQILNHNLRKVGLLGTKFTMELDFYRSKLENMGIEVVVPSSQEEREYITYTLENELGRSIFKPETQKEYLGIIQRLKDQHKIEGVILGCTEIPLLIKQDDIDIPVFDTTKIHSLAAVDLALE